MLIISQKDSTRKADRLNSKYSETRISKAPLKFKKLKFIDSLFNTLICNNKYASKIKNTPMLPTKSYQWYSIIDPEKVIVISGHFTCLPPP